MRSTLTALVVVASMGAACSFDSGGLPGGFGGGGTGDDDDGAAAGADASSTQGPAADASMPPTGTDATPAPLPVDAAPSPPPPPPPPPGPPPACDLVTSAGCAPGWACRLQWPNEQVACEPAGSFGHGHGCDGADDCAPGLDCVGVPFAGLCLRYCWVGAPDACASCGGWDPPVVVGGREAGVCTF